MASHRRSSSADRSSTRRKYAAVALALVGVAGLSLASASTLSVNTGTIQAGMTDLANCQTGAVSAAIASGGFTAGVGYTAGAVTVSGVTWVAGGGCNGKVMEVRLVDSSSNSIADLGTWTINATSRTFPAVAGINAANVAKIAVVIHD